MLQLNFKTFIERLKIQQEANRRSTVHYKESGTKFVLYFKNYEFWEYFSEVSKSDIREFGELYSVSPETAIEDFRINYLAHAVMLDPEDVDSIPDQAEPLGTPLGEINKTTDPVITEEAEDYEDFFMKMVDEWEKQVLKALNNIEVEKMYDSGFTKTFGEFVRDLFNNVHTIKFLGNLKKIIKKSMVEGMDVAEGEMDVNVGWSDIYQNKLKAFEKQQLDGYMINGKKWHGIKGTSSELRLKILKSVEEDVINKSGKDVMTKNIENIFDGVATSRARAIARTETTRFVNETKLTSYNESGIKGTKGWDAVMDGATGDLDRRLHIKYHKFGIPFDAEFVDDVTGKRFMNPPTRTNCRCVVFYQAPKSA